MWWCQRRSSANVPSVSLALARQTDSVSREPSAPPLPVGCGPGADIATAKENACRGVQFGIPRCKHAYSSGSAHLQRAIGNDCTSMCEPRCTMTVCEPAGLGELGVGGNTNFGSGAG